MSQQDPIRAERKAGAESGPQPDPMLKEGRAGATRKWGITFGIVAVVLFVMYGLTARQEMNSDTAPVSGSHGPPPGAPSSGRTTANAPASPNVATPK
jgi:hypothetical protein